MTVQSSRYLATSTMPDDDFPQRKKFPPHSAVEGLRVMARAEQQELLEKLPAERRTAAETFLARYADHPDAEDMAESEDISIILKHHRLYLELIKVLESMSRTPEIPPPELPQEKEYAAQAIHLCWQIRRLLRTQDVDAFHLSILLQNSLQPHYNELDIKFRSNGWHQSNLGGGTSPDDHNACSTPSR